MGKAKVEIFNYLPEEVNAKFDKMGYEFLESNGFPIDYKKKDDKDYLQHKLHQLNGQGLRLEYRSFVDDVTGNLCLQYYLMRGKKKMAASKQLIVQFKGEANAKEGTADA